jgi:hypothetical protein
MEKSFVDEITRILTEFALSKFSAQALEVKGPTQEGSRYRWRIVSTRYKDVTVLLRTRKLPFLKPSFTAIEVYGTTGKRKLKPTLQDLTDYIGKVELVSRR